MVDGRRERGDRRRSVLLTAGIQVVADHGTKALTHRSVAHAAGVSVASVSYHFATAHDLRDSVFRAAGERIRNAILAEVVAPAAPRDQLPALYGRAARSLLAEELTSIATVFEMIIASRHDAALAEATEALTTRLVRYLEATAAPGVSGSQIAACLQGLVLASFSLPPESRGVWLEEATINVLDRMTSE